MKRYQRLAILAALITAGCNFPIPMWPDLPSKGLCRNFRMTSWGGGAPWSEVDWSKDVVHIDEPMLPMWGWRGDLSNRDDVCGPIGIGWVRGRVDAARAANPGRKVWLNWSTDELEAMAKADCGEPLGLGADIVSFDSYGGIWDWGVRTEYMLDMMYRTLEPGQQMGLVPEAFIYGDGQIQNPPIDYVMINTLYFDWAFRHDDGRVYAMAPFVWHNGDGMIGFKSMPAVRTLLANLVEEYPLCEK